MVIASYVASSPRIAQRVAPQRLEVELLDDDPALELDGSPHPLVRDVPDLASG
jgi:hypothetical protein